MDVLRPPLMWIDGRCYRKTQFSSNSSGKSIEEETEMDMDQWSEEEVCDADYDIDQTTDGRFKTSFSVPSAYCSYIVGSKGAMRKRLENETKTQIKIPREGVEGDIVILGDDRKGVVAARTRVEVLVMSARQKEPFTHFLSVPVVDEEVQHGFLDFKADVLKKCADCRGVDDSIFQNPSKLHLTIGTLVLLNDSERKRAAQILQDCKEKIIVPTLKDSPLTLRMEGIEYMNDDPAEVDVLYGSVKPADGSDRLQLLADCLVNEFADTGLMQKQYERVKLHVTLMNTLFRSDKTGITEVTDKKMGGKPRESFDARKILETFQDYNFGVHRVKSIHVSQRYSTGPDGYYQSTGKVDVGYSV